MKTSVAYVYMYNTTQYVFKYRLFAFKYLIFQQTIIYLLLTVGYLVASSMVAWVLVNYNNETSASWLPANTRHHLITTTVIY